jgi:3-hydroxyacyl-CoA dehydrogenase
MFALVPKVAEAVSRGELGVKAGKGVFDYGEDKGAARTTERDRRFMELLKVKGAGSL